MKALGSTNQYFRSRLNSTVSSATMINGIMIVALILILLTSFAFLTKVPPVFIDESWNANAIWNWLKTGNNFDSMHAGTLDQFGHEWLRWPKIGNLPWRISFAILGLGLFQARIVSWIFACLLLVGTILIGKRTFSLTTGILAALILIPE